MYLLILLALRNLIRQKRRNLLLGLSIATGVLILVMTNAFASGLSDVILNQFMSLLTGHVEISVREKGDDEVDIIRDKHYFTPLIQSNLEGVSRIDEAVSVWARVVGLGRGENLLLKGLAVEGNGNVAIFKVKKGNIQNFLDRPGTALIYEGKAKKLNVQVGDKLRVKFRNIHGQYETTRYEVAGILNRDSVFSDYTVYIKLSELKKFMALAPHETRRLQLHLENPREARAVADVLHSLLPPPVDLIEGSFAKDGRPIVLVPVKADRKDTLSRYVKWDRGSFSQFQNSRGIAVPKAIYEKLDRRIGELHFVFPTRYRGERRMSLRGTSVFDSLLPEHFFLIPEALYYEHFYNTSFRLPDQRYERQLDKIKDALQRSWLLLPRSETFQDIMVKYARLSEKKWKGRVIDVRTMYETASDILKMEQALKGLSLVSVLVIFFIALVGVVNTLRMSIRERTQEIGTMRALGVHRREVIYIFILEMVFLSVLAFAAGVAMSLALIEVLRWPQFDMESTMAIFLVDGHLPFLIDPVEIGLSLAVVVTMAVVTAFFPARRASRIPAAEALRFKFK